ncbi:MAG TPA: InlB B-repeat-containing protein [Anaeromyxobacteraceae bacterium]|nr:InlB B-repeat-containing protein [Anaeromyxobacteraceae bacterium]
MRTYLKLSILASAIVLVACGGSGGGGGASTFTVTYNANGATSGSAPVDSNKYTQGQQVDVLGPGSLARTGYSFGGWNTQANGSGQTVTAGQTLSMGTSNLTLYAMWTSGSHNGFTVTYDGNGATEGQVPTDSTQYGPGQGVTLPGNTGNLAYAGYTFIGWQTKADGSGTVYAPGSSFTMPPSSVTLYALWAGGYAYVANHNEGNEGAISQFVIGPNGALTPMPTPTVDAGGTDTYRVAVDPSGKHLYATNPAANNQAGSVTQFAIDQTDGSLSPMSPRTAPIPTNWSPGPVTGVVHPNGSWFYEITSLSQTVWGASSAGVVQFSIGPATGTLTPPTSPTIIPDYNGGWVQPLAIALDPNAQYAYLGVGAWGCPSGQGCIAEFKIDQSTGALTSIGNTGTLPSASGYVQINDTEVLQIASGEYVYAANADSSGEIFEFSVNADGTLTSLGSLPVAPTICTCGTGGNSVTAEQIALHPSGKYAYVTFACCSSKQSVAQFTIDQSNGKLSPMTPPTVLSSGSAAYLALESSGNYAYVTSGDTGFANSTIAQYTIDQATGALTLMANPTVQTGAIGPSGIVTTGK